jgi:hypothetical protein
LGFYNHKPGFTVKNHFYPCHCQLFPAIASYRQLSPAIASYRQLSPVIASYRQLSPAIASYRQLSPAIASYRQLAQQLLHYKILSLFAKKNITNVNTASTKYDFNSQKKN